MEDQVMKSVFRSYSFVRKARADERELMFLYISLQGTERVLVSRVCHVYDQLLHKCEPAIIVVVVLHYWNTTVATRHSNKMFTRNEIFDPRFILAYALITQKICDVICTSRWYYSYQTHSFLPAHQYREGIGLATPD